MLKKMLILFGLCGCLMLSACSTEQDTDNEEIELLEPVNAKLETTYVTKMDISQVELHEGAVIPALEEFSFDENGYLYGIFVEPGDKVYKGDVLAGLMGKDYNTILDLEEEIKDLEKNQEELFAGYDKELEILGFESGANPKESTCKGGLLGDIVTDDRDKIVIKKAFGPDFISKEDTYDHVDEEYINRSVEAIKAFYDFVLKDLDDAFDFDANFGVSKQSLQIARTECKGAIHELSNAIYHAIK